ncbi:MAG TPA: dienelactone hydrolase family protein [Gammaproteobacteria bacterium]|nr:dienelactone hydrolase family protein [Gammaproteobacteria bacterium]
MRAALCLAATWLALAACTPPDSTQPAGDGSAAGASPASPTADSAAIGDETGADEPADDTNPMVPLLEQSIPYGEGADGNLVGFLAVPADAAEPLPGVLLLHEWWGLNDSLREAARRIAREGYVVLAADLYGGRTAATVPQAQALLRELVEAPDNVRANLRQAYEYLERYALAPRIGCVGWDLGGRWALQTALMLPDRLDAVVIVYGAVELDGSALETLDMPLLGLFGEQDRSIALRDVQEFRNILGRLGKPAEVRIYSGVDHGFFFPGSETYSPIAADDAWLRITALLEAGLKN